MTPDRKRKLRRGAGLRDDIFDVHGADVNTIHAEASTSKVHTGHTIASGPCDNGIDMPPDTATRLRQLRASRGVSQAEVAAAVDVDRSMISKMEKGRPGGRDLVVKLAEYYSVSLDWLLNENEPVRTAPLSDEEARLIEYFRTLPSDVADAFLKSMQAAAKKR